MIVPANRSERETRPTALPWMAAAALAAVIVAGAMLAIAGTGQDGIHLALFATGRLQFLVFLPAYAGSAAAALFGPAFGPLKRHARVFGLAFASALTVHLMLIAWLSAIGGAPGVHTFVFFGVGVLFAYALALCSVGRLQRALGPVPWWLLRTVGMNYILYAFASDFLKHPLQGGFVRVALYLPFAILVVAAPALRLAAYLRRLVGLPATREERGVA